MIKLSGEILERQIEFEHHKAIVKRRGAGKRGAATVYQVNGHKVSRASYWRDGYMALRVNR